MDVPVVLIVFNRPHCTAQVLQSLARDKPRTIFIVGDGPRDGNVADQEKVYQVRHLLDALPWPCEKVLNLSERNLGCRQRVVSGLNWVFQQVDQAVVLEDDIVPGQGFLRYCAELLEKFYADKRVGSISGVDFTAGTHQFKASYSFSRYNMFWGWATWRRAWAAYDDELSPCHEPGLEDIDGVLDRTFGLWRERFYWRKVLRRAAANQIDSWGYRWLFSCWKAGLLGVMPAVSLVDNIGTGPDATHTRHGLYGVQPSAELRFPLQHPNAVQRDCQLDRVIEDRIYSRSLTSRLKWLIQRGLGIER